MPTDINAVIRNFTDRSHQDAMPDEAAVTPTEIRANGTAVVKVRDEALGFVRESTVTLRSDAAAGFVVENESSFTRAESSANAEAAVLINAGLSNAKISAAAWFRDAVLKNLFTRNDDLSDHADDFGTLTDFATAPEKKIHVLQDMLVTVANDPARYGEDKHAVIAAILLNLPPVFWTTETYSGVPWAELYFTYDLLKKARAAYIQEPGARAEAIASYDKSIALCAAELSREQYGRWCPERYSLLETTIYDPAVYQCDAHDVQVALSLDPTYGYDGIDVAVMTPPLVAGTPDSLVGVLTADATEAGMNAAVRVLPDVIEHNPEAVTQTLRAVDQTLKDEAVRAALADLSVTAVALTDEILNDPELNAALGALVEDVVDAAATGKWVSEAAREDLDAIIRAALSQGLGVTEEALAEDAEAIRAISEKILSLAFQSARSGTVAGEVEETVLSYLGVAGRVLSDPRTQELVANTVGIAIKGGAQGWASVVSNPQDLAELQDALSESLTPVFDALAEGLDEDGKKALAQLLSHVFAASATAAIQAQEEPEMAPLMDLVGSEIVPKIETYLAWEMMTPCEQRKAARERRKAERKNAVPPFTTSGDLHAKLTYPADARRYFSVDGTKEFENGAYQVAYHVGADKAQFPFGAIEASIDVSAKKIPVDFARKAFTNYPFHEEFFVKNNILEAAPLLDAHLKTKSEGAAYAPDDRGNPASFIDAQGRAHYLVYQHLSVMGTNSEYLLDLWVEKNDFKPGQRGEMVVAWDVVPTTPDGLKNWGPVKEGNVDPKDVTAFCKRTFTKGYTHPEKNTGAWQIIDKDGDGKIDLISWGAAISGTESLQKLAPGPFTKNVYDMMRILEAQK
jgi:hypothetical protein